MDIYQEEFTSFLYYIGLLTNSTESVYQSSIDFIRENIKDAKPNNDHFLNVNITQSQRKLQAKYQLAAALELFLLKLSKENAKDISFSLINQYLNNKWKSHSDLLIKILIIYSKHNHTTQYQKFYRWSKLALNNIDKSSNGIKPVRCYYSFEDSMQNNQNNNSNKNINNVNRRNNTNSLTNLSNLSIHKPIAKATTEFLNRQIKFKESQSKAIEKVFKDSEEEYALICTFNPRIHNDSNHKGRNHYYNKRESPGQESKKHACLRLYDERISRQNRKEKLEKSAKDQIKRDTSYNKTKVDESKIIQLYEDFKVRKNKKRLLEKKMDIEMGYTYTPDISSFNSKQLNNNNNINNTNSNHKVSTSSYHCTQRSMTPIEYRSERNNLNIKINNSYIKPHQ